MTPIPRPAAAPASTSVLLDRQITYRPRADADRDQADPVRHWRSLLDAGLIGGNPPTPPDVAAQLDANDALFRRIAVDRWLARGDARGDVQ